ncbi:hypothetical protein X977_1288 [Burkholderia pseudomallei MSHR7504]|nr:hypothetical protein X977_1288 [Burkholderia pseudomallei MSHR7504]
MRGARLSSQGSRVVARSQSFCRIWVFAMKTTTLIFERCATCGSAQRVMSESMRTGTSISLKAKGDGFWRDSTPSQLCCMSTLHSWPQLGTKMG